LATFVVGTGRSVQSLASQAEPVGAAMSRTVSEKMGIKEGTRAIFVNAPEAARAAIEPPSLDVASELAGEFDYIHLFARTRAELDVTFSKLKAHLKPTGMLWVSWPKNSTLGTDLVLPKVIEIGYDHGLVESKTLSVDATWSAMKFTHPKKGKAYNNSYGRLPSS
jgi:hypothetical protein